MKTKLLMIVSLCIIGAMSCKKESQTTNSPTGSSATKIYGCMDPKAINYNPSANSDDGSCIYPPPCETNKTATIVFSNSSSNPYKVYINGAYKLQLSGGSISSQIIVNEGNNIELKAVQVSGYLISATVRTSTINLVRCTNYSWQFP